MIGVLLNPKFALAQSQLRDVRHAARAMNLELHLLRASTSYEMELAFEVIARERIAALLQISDPFFLNRRAELVALATRYRVPTMYDFGDYPAAGGLMSYGIDLADAYRQVGVYAGRILKGANPAELPIVQPTKFEFIINLKTAKTLGSRSAVSAAGSGRRGDRIVANVRRWHLSPARHGPEELIEARPCSLCRLSSTRGRTDLRSRRCASRGRSSGAVVGWVETGDRRAKPIASG